MSARIELKLEFRRAIEETFEVYRTMGMEPDKARERAGRQGTVLAASLMRSAERYADDALRDDAELWDVAQDAEKVGL
jgi:hypothetical protein